MRSRKTRTGHPFHTRSDSLPRGDTVSHTSDDAKTTVSHISISSNSSTRNDRKYAKHVKEFVEKGTVENKNGDVTTVLSDSWRAPSYPSPESPWNVPEESESDTDLIG